MRLSRNRSPIAWRVCHARTSSAGSGGMTSAEGWGVLAGTESAAAGAPSAATAALPTSTSAELAAPAAGAAECAGGGCKRGEVGEPGRETGVAGQAARSASTASTVGEGRGPGGPGGGGPGGGDMSGGVSARGGRGDGSIKPTTCSHTPTSTRSGSTPKVGPRERRPSWRPHKRMGLRPCVQHFQRI